MFHSVILCDIPNILECSVNNCAVCDASSCDVCKAGFYLSFDMQFIERCEG